MTYNILMNWNIWARGNDYILVGEIYNDGKRRFRDGTSIRTSPIREINFTEGYADTMNTRYVLGRRGSDGEIH